MPFLQTIVLLQHPHQTSRKPQHTQLLNPIDSILPFLFGEALFQHIEIVHDLAQPHAMTADMPVAVQHDENPVEGQ